MILSLKTAFSRSLYLGFILLFLVLFADRTLQNSFHRDYSPWFRPTLVVVAVSMFVVLFSCLSAYNLKQEELIQEEKEKYPWYNPLIDSHYVRHRKIVDALCEFGYWLGETFGKPKKRKERNE